MRAAAVFLSGFCATAFTQVPFDEEASLCLLQKVAAVKPVWHSVDPNPAPEHLLVLNAVEKKPLEKSLSNGRETALSSAAVASRSLASVSADLNTEGAAESAALSEDGYSAVAALGNRELMRAYVRRVAKDEGLMVTNEGSLSGALAYYTGECSTQSYAALVRELWRGTETAQCKQAWVQPIKGSSLLQTSSYPHKSHVATSSGMGQDEPETTWRWAEDLEDSLGVLQADLASLKAAVLDNEEKELMELKTKEEESRESTRESNHVEQKVLLNQEGYEQVAAKANTTEMAIFVRRVAEHEGFKVKNVKPLEGMSRYYSGECATQSFQALKNELHRVAGRNNSRCGGGPWLIEQLSNL